MPFKKGNRLGAKGAVQREKNRRDLFDLVASDHRDDYNKKLEELRDKKKLTEPEREFMDRVERLFPYVKPKLASVESKTEVDAKVQISWE